MKKILMAAMLTMVALGAFTSAAEVQPDGMLTGTVRAQASGEDLGSAQVVLIRLGDPEFTKGMSTGPDGRFAFEGLGKGTYGIFVHRTAHLPVRQWFEVDEGATTIEMRVGMRTKDQAVQVRKEVAVTGTEHVRLIDEPADTGLGSIRGEVRSGATGGKLDYANVVLHRGTGGALWGAMSIDGGRFAIEDLPAGEYTVKVLYLGYKPVERHIVLGPGASRVLEFDLEVTVVKAFDLRRADDRDAGLRKARPQDFSGPVPTLSEESALGRGTSGGSVRRQALSPQVPFDGEALERLTEGVDELWILERPGARRPVDPEHDPGTGCLVVIDEEREIPVPLEHTDVHARIDGYIASVDVRQRFHNPFEETIEAEYIFPLPHDAAVNDFLMVVGERRIRGIIREKGEAREIYERARRAGHVASLLEQERPNVFRQRVANIEPGHKIDVELHYFNALPYRGGEFEFAFPLVVGPRFNPPGSADPIGAVPRGAQATGTAVSYLAPGERSGHDVDITVELDAGVTLEDVQSLNHAVRAQRSGRSRARVELSGHDRIPNKDFVLRYRVAGDQVRSGVLTHREGGDGYFSMMLVPPASLASVQRAPVEFVFVLDCSGSMNGWPMEKSKSAMRRALKQLREGDSFQIIRFSERASALGPVPVEATADNIRRGLEYVDGLHGSGGTMMIEGIKAALDFARDPGRDRIVSFMTDGYIGNEDQIFVAVSERLGDARIFSFGVGQSVNRHLLEGMARMGEGAVAYIGLDDDLDAVDEFYRAVRHPALTDVTIDWGGMDAREVFPRRLPDLFVGRPILLHGKFDGHGDARVMIAGQVGGKTVEMEVEVDLDPAVSRASLPLIWARSELGHIADQLALQPDQDLQDRGLELALDYNLVSAWTSFVAVDATQVVDTPGDRTVPVPVPVPEGVDHGTTVGGRR